MCPGTIKKNHYSIESERPSVFDSVISTSIINSEHQPEKNIKALTNEKLKTSFYYWTTNINSIRKIRPEKSHNFDLLLVSEKKLMIHLQRRSS